MKHHLLAGAATVVLALFPAGFPLAAQPVITAVQNNYSYILPNLPNYGIAPGSLFVIIGTGLAKPGSQAYPLQNPTQTVPLPLTLNGASVSVTVDGVPGPDGATSVTTQPALYYATPTAIAAVLPSTTPVGTSVTVTVTYNDTPSQPYDTIVAQSAFGFDTYYGTGSGMAAVTDNNPNDPNPLITPTNSAKPGETVVFWGSGVGPDIKNNDRNPPVSIDQLTYITQLFIGGVEVPIVYQGRSTQYPGVDQIDVTLPPNVPTGCAVSVTAVSGAGSSAVVSNTVTIPIAASGGACTDPLQPIGSTEAAALSGHTLVNFGSLALAQITNTSGIKTASAQFASIPGASLFPYLSNTLPSLGSCVVYQQAPPAPTNPFQLEGLNPGTVDVTGPNGTEALNTVPSGPGLYTVALTLGFIPPTGGQFTFVGQGGTDVQAFNAPLAFPNPLNWTIESTAGAITRAQGLTVNWTGNDPDTYVQVAGSATTVGVTVFFTCDALASAGTFTVPPAVLLALPAAGGGITFSSFTLPTSFSATGLDFGFATSYASVFESTTYQ
jgi:uncharacterized protein (TIGR03437 family)